MKLKISPFIYSIIFLIIFFVFYKGLQNSNIYTPNLKMDKNIPSFKTKTFENENYVSEKIFKKDRNSYSFSIGQFGKIISILKKNKCKKVLFAGKVHKPNFSKIKFDLKGLYYIPRIIKKTPNRSRRRSIDLLVVTIGRFFFLFVTVIIQAIDLVNLKGSVNTKVLVVKVIKLL